MAKKLLLWLLLTGTTLGLLGQTYIAQKEVVNFSKQTYKAGSQNWDIRQDSSGRIYIANNEGVLTFDGTYWKLYPLPNKTIVRSIEFGEDKRLYAGGQDEIGYYSPDNNGKLTFTSLKDLLPPTDRDFSDVWDIVCFKGDVFFRSNYKLIRYSNNRMTVHPPLSSWNFIGIHAGHVIAHDEKNGLLTFSGGKWETLIERNKLPNDLFISSIAPVSGDTSLITTSGKGLFLLAGNNLLPFRLEHPLVDNNQNFSSCLVFDRDNILIGTYTNGMYHTDGKGRVIEMFSKKEGLQNSNVRALFLDRDRNIWMGLDNGIDYIAYNNAVTHINPALFNDGGGFSVTSFENRLIFGLSTGIFSVPYQPGGDLSYTPNLIRALAGGQTWQVTTVNGDLLAGRDDGFYRIEGDRLILQTRSSGYWDFKPLRFPGFEGKFVGGNYYGINLFQQNGNGYTDLGPLSTYNSSARYIVIDKSFIWISHPYRGVYKIDPRDSSVRLYTEKNGLPSTLNNQVYHIRKGLLVATEKGVYEYDSKTDRFVPSETFKPLFGETSIRYLQEDKEGNIWFVHEKSPGVLDYSGARPQLFYLPELKGRILSGFEQVYPLDEENVFVGGERGFYHVNYRKYRERIRPIQVHIRSVKVLADTDSLLFGGYYGDAHSLEPISNSPRIEVPYRWNSFVFEFSSPLFVQHSSIEYSYKLDGFDEEWSPWSGKTDKEYTKLPAGTYTFRVKARSHLNNESPENTYRFTVLPPWYQTTYARVVYLLLVLAAGYLYYKWQEKRHIRKQERRFEEEKARYEEEQKRMAYLHQLELEKSEKELAQLKNEKLEAEIEFKNAELASSTMNLVQKKEFILKLKEELQHLNRHGKDTVETAELKKMLRILSEEEKLNDEWEHFSVHFNKVHGDFLVILKEKYPDLKPHELKLCAYLRMNLSSKEIAQLMSISVRGVEISRYRLRKKLQIPTEVNLFQFLFDLQMEKK